MARLRRALASVEADAEGLRWAKERPWRVATHVHWQAELPTLDGHDLNAKLMKRAMRVVRDEAASLDTGAVLIVTGRGRHSLGRGPVLPGIVTGVLGPVCEERGWLLQPRGPAAWVLITDRARAPASATGDWGWGMWLLLGFFAAAAVAVVLGKLGVI